MTKATLNATQIANARLAFHYALCASTGTGLSPEHTPSADFTPQRTRTDYIKAAWAHAKQTGFELARPRGPVDGAPLAGTIHELCARLGIDANTGAGILPAVPACASPARCNSFGMCAVCRAAADARGPLPRPIVAAPIVEEPVSADEDEELVPEPHRCRDAGGYCAHCLS